MTRIRSRKIDFKIGKLGQSFQLQITALFFESYIVFHLLLKRIIFHAALKEGKKIEKKYKICSRNGIFKRHALCAKTEGGFEKIKLSILPIDLAFS